MKIYYKKLSQFLCVLLLVATLLVSIPPPAKASSGSSTTTNLVSAPASTVYGQPVTFTATVNPDPPWSSQLTGTVTFNIQNHVSVTQPLTGNTATITLTDLPVGTLGVYAKYNGDSNYNPSISGNIIQDVERAYTTLNISTSPNPSVYGQTITFKATVTANSPGAGTPTGIIDFVIGGGMFTSYLDDTGSAEITLSDLVATVYSVGGQYYGDTNFRMTNHIGGNVTVDKASTSTTITSIPNPSDNGQTVEFTAVTTAVPPGAGVPTGAVDFIASGTVIGSSPLVGGKAVYPTSLLPFGQTMIVAEYTGDSNFIWSDSLPYFQVVRAETSISLESSKNPSNQNDNVIFTASGLPPDATGNVTFYDGGETLGISDVSGGSASLSLSTLTAGTHQITARYGGDSSYMPSVSPAYTQAVQFPYAYTVRYLNVLSGKPIAPDTSGAGQLGDKVTVTAPTVSGFILQDAPEKTITITAGTNSAEFLYVPISAVIVFAAFLLLFALIGIFAIILQARVQ